MIVKAQLEAVEIKTFQQVQVMRIIRNMGSAGFSHDHDYISVSKQRAWWTSMQGRVRAWLYQLNGGVIGFGLIRELADGRWAPSAGVRPRYRGQGYGGRIVDDLVDQARARGITLHAEALLSNPAAVKTHHPDRWESLGSDELYARFRST